MISDADGILITLEADKPQEDNIKIFNTWMIFAKEKASKSVRFYVLMNKKDKIKNDLPYNYESFIMFCKDQNAEVFWVSAFTKEGVEESLRMIIEDITCFNPSINQLNNVEKSRDNSSEINLNNKDQKKKKGSGCCSGA